MAVQKVTPAVAAAAAVVVVVSKGITKEIQGEKRGVLALSAKFGEVREKVRDMADRILDLFKRFQMEAPTGTTYGLADFARQFDPTVPTHAGDRADVKGYRNHPVYATINYMKQIQRGKKKAANAAAAAEDGVDTLSAASAKLVRSLKTLIQVVKDPEPIYRAFQAEWQMNDRAMKTLRKRVLLAQPLVDLTGIVKPFNVESARVLHGTFAPGADAALMGKLAATKAAVEGGEVRAERGGGRRPRQAKIA